MVKRNAGRRLFHTTGGALDLSRLVEQAVPAICTGIVATLVTTYVTVSVVREQVSSVREDITSMRLDARDQAQKLGSQAEKLISLQAQVTAYLGQQNELNRSTADRLLYLERARESGAVTATTTIKRGP
jgi:hypothetical protein